MAERLDKYIAGRTTLTRSEIKALVRQGRVLVNGCPAGAPEQRVGPGDQVMADGRELPAQAHLYLMLNKPQGVVSATRDDRLPTVLDLVPPELRRKNLFPAGRLDKDTEGFVLLTDDGALAHRMLSPRSHVPKVYHAEIDRPVTPEMEAAFTQGMALGEERCLPAGLLVLRPGPPALVQVTLREGMYHQIKRMFGAFGAAVLSLRRVQIGGLPLDGALPPGGCRPLSAAEIDRLLEQM